MLGFDPLSSLPFSVASGLILPTEAQRTELSVQDVKISAGVNCSVTGEALLTNLNSIKLHQGIKATYNRVVFNLSPVGSSTDVNWPITGEKVALRAGKAKAYTEVFTTVSGVRAEYTLKSLNHAYAHRVRGVNARVDIKDVGTGYAAHILGERHEFNISNIDLINNNNISITPLRANLYSARPILSTAVNYTVYPNYLNLRQQYTITWGKIMSCRDTVNEWARIKT